MGFLNPGNLLWALSIAALIVIYLRSRSRPTLEVSSLLLFDETAAPAARVKNLRIDPLFWLEMTVFAAIALALAGLYLHLAPAAAKGRSRALVFDLAAGMSAREGGGTRLDLARKQAFRIIDSASDRDQFSVIGYALEAEMIHPETGDREALRKALLAMKPMAVPAHRAALAAALMRARAAGEVDLFADREPAGAALADSGLSSRLRFHQAGMPAGNVAIVSLDPGVVNGSPGRIVLRNFGARPAPCKLEVECSGVSVFDHTVILAPREQLTVPFGPLAAGGLVHARILSADALSADNERYAYAAPGAAARVLVLSPDAAVRDDLARILLAVDGNFIVTAEDPPKLAADGAGPDQYALAVMHDCYLPRVKARSTLLVYPPPSVTYGGPLSGLRVAGNVAAAEMTGRPEADSNATPAILDATRVMTVPDWMTIMASGAAPGIRDALPMAAGGLLAEGRFGVLAFDLRGHLLLDPDRLDALVATVELIRELSAPEDLRIVSTGTFLAIPAPADARVTAPDGTVLAVSRDKWGRLRLRPVQAGHYRIESASRPADVYANYYDAAESDLTAAAALSASPSSAPAAEAASAAPKELQPLTLLLLALALGALVLESALLLKTANRWAMRHV